MFWKSEQEEYAICDFCMRSYARAYSICQGCGKVHVCAECMKKRGVVKDQVTYPPEWWCHPCVMLGRIAEALAPKMDMQKHEARDQK